MTGPEFIIVLALATGFMSIDRFPTEALCEKEAVKLMVDLGYRAECQPIAKPDNALERDRDDARRNESFWRAVAAKRLSECDQTKEK